ncbi:DUF3016 domain-containing protein [Cognaticolwellia beringensis]|uniref:DUF3016 domain-containing protein n=1 Tax=Cognaticolwellia beringensis TaxID=1967665 RepID=A0A222G9L2_9GAMM|nr:DUF3016 domain-containing protein [Cognaticolwellia beringensis]ASP48313.1 DUF3016 domain-containing protein [Cognaticolwellia beringensis]
MTKIITCLLSLAIVISQNTAVQAAQVEVKWTNPDKYTDVDAGEEHRQHFKDRTFKAFEKHFAKLAELLPENQKLIFDITNVDLAGDVNFGGVKRIRIVKDLFFPRMEFSYQLLNADNSVIKSEEVSLKDMGFMMHSGLRYRNQTLGYEKEMLDDWFKKTFENEMVK